MGLSDKREASEYVWLALRPVIQGRHSVGRIPDLRVFVAGVEKSASLAVVHPRSHHLQHVTSDQAMVQTCLLPLSSTFIQCLHGRKQ